MILTILYEFSVTPDTVLAAVGSLVEPFHYHGEFQNTQFTTLFRFWLWSSKGVISNPSPNYKKKALIGLVVFPNEEMVSNERNTNLCVCV